MPKQQWKEKYHKGNESMIITMSNYRSYLPKSLHQRFVSMAGLERGAIIFKSGVLRYAHINEV